MILVLKNLFILDRRHLIFLKANLFYAYSQPKYIKLYLLILYSKYMQTIKYNNIISDILKILLYLNLLQLFKVERCISLLEYLLLVLVYLLLEIYQPK